jgi:hypothetical protein
MNVSDWWMHSFIAYLFVFMAMPVLRDIAHLPLARRTVFPFVLLPSLVPTAVGFALAESPLLSDVLSKVDKLVRYPPRGELLVPTWLWRLSRGGSPPTVQAPSGESFTPQAHSRPFGLVAWNPYEIGRYSSRSFAEYQAGRAVEDYCGGATWKQRVERAPAVVTSFITVEYPDCEPRWKARQAKSLILVLFWFLGCWLATIRNRPPPSLTTWRLRKAAEIAVPAILVLIPSWILKPRFRAADPLSERILDHHFVSAVGHALPHSPVLAWGVVALLFMGACWILRRRLERMEVPPPIAANRWFGATR